MTVTSLVALPHGLVTVNLYVVVCVGETAFVPDVDTVPTPLSIVAVDPPVLVQESVVDCPVGIADGLTVKALMLGAEVRTVTVTFLLVDKSPALTVSLNVVVFVGDPE